METKRSAPKENDETILLQLTPPNLIITERLSTSAAAFMLFYCASGRGGEADLVFLVDSSASVGAETFYNEIKFIRKLLADFTVSENTTRVK